jgi:hypothetical protein
MSAGTNGPLFRRGGGQMGKMSPLGGAVGRRRDLFYLYAARVARGFGDGFASILLPAYPSELGFDGFQKRIPQQTFRSGETEH